LPELGPPREIATKIEKKFLFLEWAQCCKINSTQLNAAPVTMTRGLY